MYNILLVDDDRSMLITLQTFLNEEFNILYSPNFKSGSKQLKKSSTFIDVCIIDYCLPDGDGLELIKQAKSKFCYIPVIFITGYPSLHIATTALSLDYNADYFITKPFDIEYISQIIHKCISKGGKKHLFNALSIIRNVEYKSSNQISKRKEKHRLREIRLYEIIKLIELQPLQWTCGKLSNKFSVSRQQIHRDIKEIQNRNFNIISSKNGYFKDDKNTNSSDD